MLSRRILVMTAVDAERDAVLRGLRGDDRFEVALAGVGPAAAAVRTAAKLAEAASAPHSGYGLVISAGIGGGFVGIASIGSLVISSRIVAADLGAETPDGFMLLDELGFGSAIVEADLGLAQQLCQAMTTAGLTACVGPVLTVSTVTGTAETAAERAARIEGAAAEGMEGFGVATAARHWDLPVLEIRAISNPVGPRNRAAWRIKDALEAIEAASSIWPEVLFKS